MKKVLLIAYIFPPLGGGGVQRTLKFVKYLPQFGWKPYVLTPKNAVWGGADYDETLLADIPAMADIVKTNNPESYHLMKHFIKHFAPRKFSSFSRTKTSDSRGIDGSPHNRQNTHRLSVQANEGKQSKKISLINWLKIWSIPLPDSKFDWIPFAVKKGIEIIEKEDIDVIYSTSPPNTDHIIGLLLKKFTQKTWVADFRDPWLSWQLMETLESMPIRNRIEQILETAVIKNANRVIDVSEPITQMHKERFPQYLANKAITITNGYDPDDFSDVIQTEYQNDSKIRMIYFGKLFKNRSPINFLKALAMLRDEYPHIEQQLEVLFVGQFDQSGSKEHQEAISNHKLTGIVKVLGYLPHHEVLNLACQCDFLLLIEGDYHSSISKGIYTGKLFEYIALKKPIFGVLPEGCARDLIIDSKLGMVADHNDVVEIKEKLKIFFHLTGTHQIFQPNPSLMQQFSRVTLTSKLVAIFNSLIGLKHHV